MRSAFSRICFSKSYSVISQISGLAVEPIAHPIFWRKILSPKRKQFRPSMSSRSLRTYVVGGFVIEYVWFVLWRALQTHCIASSCCTLVYMETTSMLVMRISCGNDFPSSLRKMSAVSRTYVCCAVTMGRRK